ncbi:MAG TPA: hypothetical protein VG148_06835 [Pyrinomonadaceae bacterium]|nr:hypothetical protein [Pyrinomonadaceae bacterium]
MSEKVLKELTESIREAGQILRGEREPSRVFEREAPPPREPSPARFAICVQTDDPELLIPRKIYEITPLASGRVLVIDEAGESTICPADTFMLIDLPREVEEALSRVA